MKAVVKRYFVIGILPLFGLVGCAKQGMVKQDQTPTPLTVSKLSDQSSTKPAAPEAPKPKKTDMAEAPVYQPLSTAQSAQTSGQAASPSLQEMLGKIYFDFDSSLLSSQARGTLAKNAELLRKNPGSKIRIEGNCDEIGSDDYNLALGERRAEAAKRYLLQMGIEPGRLTVVSYGSEKPVATGHEAAARAKNRRDEFVLLVN